MAPTSTPTNQDLANALAELKQSIDKSSSKTLMGQILLAAFTAIFTSLFGFVAFDQQARIQESNEAHLKELASHLTLTEEFFRRKLNVYEKLIDDVVALERASEDAENDSSTAKKQQAMSAATILNSTYMSNNLYIGSGTFDALERIFSIHTRLPALSGASKNSDSATIEDLRVAVKNLRKQMSADLHLTDVGEMQ